MRYVLLANMKATIQPYVRTTQRQKFVDPRYHKYAAWKRTLRIEANVAGFPRELKSDRRYRLSLDVYWRGKARADLDNLVKAVLDGLFDQDRRVLVIDAGAWEHVSDESMDIGFYEETA